MTNFTPQVKRVGKNDKEQLKFAFGLAKEKRFDEALAEFETILQNNPSAKLAHLGAGNMLFRQERYDEALRRYQTVIRLDPLMSQAHIAAGRVYLRQGDLEQAKEKFQSALSIDPNLTDAYQSMGQVLARQEKYDEAIDQWRKALRLDPQLIPARLLMTQVYQTQGKLAEALAELKAAVNIDPTMWRIYQSLGRVYLQQKDYTSAIEAFEEVLKLNPDLPPAAQFGLVEALIAENQLEEAGEILRQMPKNKPLEPRKHQLWGDIYQAQGLLKEAREEYRAASLLAAEEGDTQDEFADLDKLFEQDEAAFQQIGFYRAAAEKRVSDAQQRQRKSFRDHRMTR
jgi:tetratricopeptide (TPR) repeat protein